MTRGVDLRKAVVFGAPKEAALYFDRVLPIDFAESFFSRNRLSDSRLQIPVEDGDFDRKVISSLLRQDSSDEIYSKITDISMLLRVLGIIATKEGRKSLTELPEARGARKGIIARLGIDIDEIAKKIENGTTTNDELIDNISKEYISIVKDSGFENCAVWRSMGSTRIQTATQDAQKFSATLGNLNIVDATQISWEQVLEIRSDESRMAALRDLRLFFGSEYKDKGVDFIIDDLSSRIYQYEEAVKIWGLKTVQKSLSVVFDKGSVMASSIAAITTQIMGGAPLLSAIAGGGMALGSASLEIGKVYIDQRSERIKSPVRYLSDLKNI